MSEIKEASTFWYELRVNFYVENGQLFCRVFFLCADTEDGYAAESLRIRYDLIDTTVTASEITFLRTETEDAQETP